MLLPLVPETAHLNGSTQRLELTVCNFSGECRLSCRHTLTLQQEVEGTAVRVQLVLPGAVISEGWEVAGGDALEALPESIVMTTEDCVDVALAGLDHGEPITAPRSTTSPCWGDYLMLSGTMLVSVFDARPAGR